MWGKANKAWHPKAPTLCCAEAQGGFVVPQSSLEGKGGKIGTNRYNQEKRKRCKIWEDIKSYPAFWVLCRNEYIIF